MSNLCQPRYTIPPIPSRPPPGLPAVRRAAPNSNMASFRATAIGRALCYVLRHGARENRLTLGSDGYADMGRVLATQPMQAVGAFEDELFFVTRTDGKQRFRIEDRDGQLFIRCNQGHTMGDVDVAQLATELGTDDLPNVIVHGTKAQFSENIRWSGLLAGSRNEVHFAIGLMGDARVKSGMRNDCDLFVYLDGPRAVARGVKLFRSSNDVILSPGVVSPDVLWATDADGAEVWRVGVLADRSRRASAATSSSAGLGFPGQALGATPWTLHQPATPKANSDWWLVVLPARGDGNMLGDVRFAWIRGEHPATLMV